MKNIIRHGIVVLLLVFCFYSSLFLKILGVLFIFIYIISMRSNDKKELKEQKQEKPKEAVRYVDIPVLNKFTKFYIEKTNDAIKRVVKQGYTLSLNEDKKPILLAPDKSYKIIMNENDALIIELIQEKTEEEKINIEKELNNKTGHNYEDMRYIFNFTNSLHQI